MSNLTSMLTRLAVFMVLVVGFPTAAPEVVSLFPKKAEDVWKIESDALAALKLSSRIALGTNLAVLVTVSSDRPWVGGVGGTGRPSKKGGYSIGHDPEQSSLE